MRLSSTRNVNIGLLIDWLAPGYQAEVLRGVARAADQMGCTLLVFFGGPLIDAKLEEPNNSVFSLARRPVVDGVVAMMGSLSVNLGPEQAVQALRSLDVPCSSLGLIIEGIPSVAVDNSAGLVELCEHLVNQHGARRFAMIAGPVLSSESQQRVAVCRSVLSNHGLELPDDHISHQEFDLTFGPLGVDELFGARKLTPDNLDVLLCANDLLAEGALTALAHRGIRVPDDLLLTGFDGLDRAGYLNPPLTTVAQPLPEQGYAVCRALVNSLNGIDTEARTLVAPKLILRGSCGCRGGSEDTVDTIPERTAGATVLLRDLDSLRAGLARAAAGEFASAGEGWEERWVHAVFFDISSEDSNSFLTQLEVHLRRQATSRPALEVCHRALGALRREVLGRIGEPKARNRFENIAHEASKLARDALERFEANRRTEMMGTLYSVLHAMDRLVRLAGQSGFYTQLQTDLLRLGIHSCFVSRFDGTDTSRLVFAFSSNEQGWAALADRIFPTREILPDGRIQQARDYPLAIRSLVHADKALGTVVFSLTARDITSLESLAAIVALHVYLESSR